LKPYLYLSKWRILIDWLTALRHISTDRHRQCQETLLNKIWSRFVDKYNCVWRNADWPALWHITDISTKSYHASVTIKIWRFRVGGGAPTRKVGGAQIKSAAFGGACGLVLSQQYQLFDLLISVLIYENMQAELRKTF